METQSVPAEEFYVLSKVHFHVIGNAVKSKKKLSHHWCASMTGGKWKKLSHPHQLQNLFFQGLIIGWFGRIVIKS